MLCAALGSGADVFAAKALNHGAADARTVVPGSVVPGGAVPGGAADATNAAAPVDAPLAVTEAGAAGAGAVKGPIEVQVVFWVYDVRDINLEEGSFVLDGTLELRWQDDRLDPNSEPLFEVMNAMELRADAYGHKLRAGWHVMTWRLHGKLRANFDLRAYPFDVHDLPVTIEHPLLEAGDFVLRSELEWHPPAGLDVRKHRLGPDFTTRDWALRDLATKTTVVDYGLGERYSRYTLSLRVARDPLRFFLSDLAPIIMMVLLGLAASLIPPDKIDGKLLLTVLALLVAVELQVVASERLPPVGYLTIVDWTYAFAYLSIAIAVLQAIFEYRRYAAGDVAGARKIRVRGVVASVAVFALPLVWLIAARV